MVASTSRLKLLLNVCAWTSVALFALPAVYYPAAPQECRDGAPDYMTAAHADEMEKTETGTSPEQLPLLASLQLCCKSRACVLLLLVGGVTNGIYTSWTAVLPIVFQNLDGYASSDGDVLAFIALLAYAIGGYAGGEVADRLFARKLKRLLLILYTCSAVSFGWLLLSLPCPFVPASWLMTPDFTKLVVCISLTGIFAGASAPVCLELLAEVSYPVAEGVTGNVVCLLMQIAAVFIVAVTPVVNPTAISPIMAGTYLAFASLAIMATEVYLRKDSQSSTTVSREAGPGEEEYTDPLLALLVTCEEEPQEECGPVDDYE